MTPEYGIIVTHLIDIKTEIQNQLVKEDRYINTGKLIELSSYLANKSLLAKIPSEEAKTLDGFGKTFYFQMSVRENLELRLEDVNKLISMFRAKLES